MPIRPVDMQVTMQQSGGVATQQAARLQAPLAAQAQAEAAEPQRSAQRQATVARSLKGEAHAIGERPAREERGGRRQRGRNRSGLQRGPDDGGEHSPPREEPQPDGKGRMLDVRY